ncbi:MAG: tetratricopeptide repeat protein [Verrucomicrobiota bacterium]|nr:tetratricopeptide repeat protein [Verrucomicrobiota bacterium]
MHNLRVLMALGLFVSIISTLGQALPSVKPLDAKRLAKQIRDSIVVLTQFGRDDNEEGVGTGFVVSADGLIATSLHVIGEGRPIQIRLANGDELEVASVHAWDRALDLAILRVNNTGLTPLPIGDSSKLSQGSPVVAMGTPHGLEFSFVQGVLSARRIFESVEMLQVALPIEPGNSGGPMLDLHGRVHGVITLKSLVTDNLGFAVPSNLLKPLLEKPNPVPIKRWMTIGQLSPKEWTTVFGGHWRKKGGGINVSHAGESFGGRALCLSTRDVPETPFELAVEVKLESESGAAGLAWAADGGNRHYGFYPSAGQMRLTRFDGANVFSWSILDQRITRHYLPGDWNTLRVRNEGDRFYCYVNGHLIFESSDRGLSAGRVGLAKFRNTVASFRNFQLDKMVSDNSSPIDSTLGQALISESTRFGGFKESTIASAGESPVKALRHLDAEAKRLEQQAALLRQSSEQLHRRLVRDQLTGLFEKEEKAVDLFKASMLIAKIDDPSIDIPHYVQQLKLMSNEVRERFESSDADDSKLKKMLSYLFQENGFHGSRQDYYNQANSYMNRVLDDREGLPITLSVLVMELARQCGISNVVGVGAPGHFIVKHVYDNKEQFIDPFDGGKLLTIKETEALVRENSGRIISVDGLLVSTKREIALRMLRNLMGVAQNKDAPADLLRYVEPMVALQPDSAFDRWARAVLLIQSRKFDAAKKDLEWLLQNKPEGVDLKRVLEVYQSLQ